MPYTVAFFGATGGCTNACLTHLLLSSDYKAIALVRTPQKLIDSLKRQPGITDAILAQKLSIVQGDATDVATVKRTLLFQGDGHANSTPKLVDAIISGIGAYPRQQTTTTLVSALREIYAEQQQQENKPVVTVISTTGLASPAGAKEDVPIGLRTLYHSLLAEPHKDKKRMEEILSDKENSALFRGVVIVRPTLLKGDGIVQSKDASSKTVRAGTEFEPVTGYTISRADVGRWIWKNMLLSEDRGEKWIGRRVSLAY
ncbi:conserved hypothetical protein [Talaromyces stipitatus ATCC 10500]|uniref:NAD(P)-binding domain-containing protein n=1 Tax=Talaromyces stipitatus (strain ATCC 10500 / CBS 375.48 / QM 6759 / NRRL 1006) TaxID=441959 RepID=B8MIU1_TALSN|nr:uncharacterized protein TSTA_050420 [Talaromyces stipitatus ATCC 10500]EED15603.1 conserved hypothetical protein [Talaromyces stipitatus ATCC 10500]